MESAIACLLTSLSRMGEPQAEPSDIDKLTEAAVNGDLEEIHEILSRHRDDEFFIDGLDSQGHTPLTALLFRGSQKPEEELPSPIQEDVLEELYKLGASFEVPDRFGVTPLFASLYADLDVIVAVARYADLENKMEDGRSFLMVAAAMGLLDVLDLFDRELNVNEKDSNGNTILHHAVLTGEFFPTRCERYPPKAIIEFLCAHGIDTFAENNDGKSALRLANEMEQYDVALVIRHCDLPEDGFRQILIQVGDTSHVMKVHVLDTVSHVKQAFFGPLYRNFDLLFPAFRIPGKSLNPQDKLMVDDRALSDYNIQNGSTLVPQVKLKSGVRGGKQTRRRNQFKKTRRHRKN